mmetsp:Transcript_27586/g.60437  ORF Transcript_27586/g.60437 Transcript_27586/m.60437 type:complete len:1174 (+) Transcript_27586:191-3712(+)
MDHSKEKEEGNSSTQKEMEVEEEFFPKGGEQDGVVARAGVPGASDNNGGCGAATTDGLGSATLPVGLKPSSLSSSSSVVVSRSSISSASRMSSNRRQIQSTSSEEEESEAELDDEDSHSRLRQRSPQTPRTAKRKEQLSDCANDDVARNEVNIGRKLSSPAGAAVAAALGAFGSESAGTSWDPLEKRSHKAALPPAPPSTATTRTYRRHRHHHLPNALPSFRDPRASMWTSTHDANAPSEDRYCSLVNVLLRPPPSKMGNTENISSSGSSGSGSDDDLTQMDEATQVDPRPHPYEEDNTSLIRLSLWSVIDGHGGGCVATYASEVLLPHIAASVARALKCTIVDRGHFYVNGQLRDVNALDLDGLIRSSDRGKTGGGNIDVVNPNSIHYKSPREVYDSESEGEAVDHTTSEDGGEQLDTRSPLDLEPPISVASSLRPRTPLAESVSSVKTSVKTAVSPVTRHAPVGTHSASEVAEITKAITHSFLSVDEGWINSIDPVTTHQTSCISNGKWNAGACALVVFTVQRLDWTRSSTADPETEFDGRGAGGGEDTSHNKDAARRRKLDYATKSKSVSSLSTLSSTSSLATVGPPTAVSVQESEITETEDDDDVSDIFGPRRRVRRQGARDDPHHTGDAVISTPGGCKCHFYRPHDAMLYTAHVGDCRAVMLGSAPPRTIKVRPEGEAADAHVDSSDDYSSCDTSSGESEGMSSSDRDSDSSDGVDEDDDAVDRASAPAVGASAETFMTYMRRPSKRQCRRRNSRHSTAHPFAPLPSLSRSGSSSSEESEAESDDSAVTTVEPGPAPEGKKARRSARNLTRIAEKITGPEPSEQTLFSPPLLPPPLPLSPMMRPIDLTTDHSAYNPAEVTAVLRRCNNAPRAISAASGGGIKRVAGSLAVTRALGDAYLKTPLLSFFPYKRHAPYITARPEVNCRLLSKGGDRVLILATDGVWERCSGDDVLRWVRNYYNERIAGVERHHYRHRRLRRTHSRGHHHHGDKDGEATIAENSSLGLGSSSSPSEPSDLETKLPSDTESKCDTTAPPMKGSSSGDGESLAGVGGKLLDDIGQALAPKNRDSHVSGHKRKRGSGVSNTTHSSSGSSQGEQRRSRFSSSVHNDQVVTVSTVSDVIVRRVLNKVRRARSMKSLRALMDLPRGRARRSKHDDITASVIDMSGFVS